MKFKEAYRWLESVLDEGGPGSGRYPAGSGKGEFRSGDKVIHRSGKIYTYLGKANRAGFHNVHSANGGIEQLPHGSFERYNQ